MIMIIRKLTTEVRIRIIENSKNNNDNNKIIIIIKKTIMVYLVYPGIASSVLTPFSMTTLQS